jgi:hypothetical protein
MSTENCKYLKIAYEELENNPGKTSARCDHVNCSIEVEWKTKRNSSDKELYPHATDTRFSYCGRLLARMSQLEKMLAKKSHPLRGDVREMREEEYGEKTEEAGELGVF